MKKIFLIGAGRSATDLIEYLLSHAEGSNWKLTIGDVDVEMAKAKTKNHPLSEVILFDVHNKEQREKCISSSDLVISMLPAHLHMEVAEDCVRFGKHMATASYISPAMRLLQQSALDQKVILMNEVGLDPGIDHASAMKVIDEIKSKGGELISFKSYCGGLVAPECNDNPWGYKFSWNPRNVVLAGQGTAQFVSDQKLKYIPYNRLFLQTERIEVEEWGNFEAYANRDSISYKEIYGIENIPSLLRGTLRYPGYCKAWNIFVKLGLTEDSYKINVPIGFTYSDLLESYLPGGEGALKERLIDFMGNDADPESIENVAWLGFFDGIQIQKKSGTPAELLQDLLETKWKLKHGDKDLVVMQHQFEYKINQENYRLTSTLVVKGVDELHTAMSKTVGLPLAITVSNILSGKINTCGVQLPVTKEIYEPLLAELKNYGIDFVEKCVKI